MKTGFIKSFVKSVIFLSILILFFCLALKLFSPTPSYVKDSKYYAVFLTNGQVYFGTISEMNQEVVMLHNVHYLRANTNLQDIEEQQEQANVELSLIKLGNELHGPKDMMTINRTNILFWEELRNDGKVMQAIRRNQS